MTMRGPSLIWLGQAGFLLDLGDIVVLIDPYLSDSLAEKYRGRRFAHLRMMAPPITAEALARVDLVLCTHRHGDHMDPGTLPVIATRHPDCRFVVPAAERRHAQTLGLPEDRLVLAAADETIELLGLAITPVPAAHESLECDEAGRHRFLGYGIAGRGCALYHSGDCIPYPGLAARVAALGARLALLPVNGRDAERASAGIPGNFTLDEAAALCREAAIPVMLAHHWGMFDFNTCDPVAIASFAATTEVPRIIMPQPGLQLRIGSDG
ncbi:MBL fold metallo-hydrolase [Lichenicoccus sp.]|uniref:MBL fold metallo-hydrolase n=1 Tax=Lichenicoccus sp. TaxID=2781899 RepID=UPI003D0FE0E8